MKNGNGIVFALLCLALIATGIHADTVPANTGTAPTTILRNPNGANFDNFGAAIALSSDGSILLSGAPETIANTVSGGVAQVGRAYVFIRTDHGFDSQPALVLDDPDPLPIDEFGANVAISGDGNTLLVSASGGDSGLPRVYVFDRNSGAPLAVLESPDGGGDCFGQSLALSGDGGIALVAANCAAVNGLIWAGKVYSYIRSNGNWSPTPVAMLTEPVPAHNDFFGTGVALSADGRTALIGSDDYLGADPVGRAYVFSGRAGTWNAKPDAVLRDPGATPGSMFGSAVSLSSNGTTALVGAGNGSAGKEAYIFERSNGAWRESAALDEPVAQTGSGFVNTVKLSADAKVALVGLLTGTGTAQLFVRADDASWPQHATLILNDPAATNGNDYGWSAALSADGAVWVIGSPYAVSHPSPAGSLFSSMPGPGRVYGYNKQSTTAAGSAAAISPAAVFLLCALLGLRRAMSPVSPRCRVN
ncbi:MAG TPA: hypothetical protein VFX47_00800 [Gammaproteobacteria bacterium]|nr:hypothetical protein [Gammaproteobacteria bacterium]